MRGKAYANGTSLRGLEHALGEFEEVFIGIALFRKRNVGRLLVSAFHQTNPGFQRKQRLEIIRSSIELSLDTQTSVGVQHVEFAIRSQSRIDMLGLFHVDQDEVS